jgi:predicted HicB family RNase H-like nuclease
MPAEFSPDTVQLATRIPKALHVRIRVDALDRGVTLAEWVGDALSSHLETCTGKKRSRKPAKGAEGSTTSAA